MREDGQLGYDDVSSANLSLILLNAAPSRKNIPQPRAIYTNVCLMSSDVSILQMSTWFQIVSNTLTAVSVPVADIFVLFRGKRDICHGGSYEPSYVGSSRFLS